MAAENPIDFNKFITGEDALKGAARSVRALAKDTASLGKTFGEDAGRIRQGFGDIATALKELQGKVGKLNLITDADKKLLQEYITQVGALKTQKALLKESEAAQAAAAKLVTDATKAQTDALKQQKEALRAAAAANDVQGQQKAAAAIRSTTQENNQLARALRGVNSEFTAAKGSYDALTLANGKLLAQLRGLEGGLDSTSKEAAGLRGQIAANTAQLTDFDKQLGQNFRNVGNYPKGLKAAGEASLGFIQTLTGVTIGLAGVAQGLKQVFDDNVQFSDAIADVRKTTGLTADEADRLVTSLKQLDTRTSLAGLLDIAKVGGQLGIARGDILDFTKAVDVANQALGDDFTGGAEEIATELGKIAGVFRKELGPDVAQNLLAIGSAVNELGAEGAATAPFLADVALRTGAVAAQTGVGLKNILAYASVLQETGFNAEASGTALNRFFSVLSTRTEAAFRIAQKANPALTLKEFTKLVNTDFNQAIQVFLKGLNAGGKTTTQLSGLLSTLKLQSGEAKNVIITLAQNTELFAQRQQTANTQLREATSLAAEAAIKDDDLAGSVNKLKNDIGQFATGPESAGVLKFLVDFTRQTLKSRVAIGILTLGVSELVRSAADLKERLSPVTQAQEDYTIAVVAGAKETLKQADAQQRQLAAFVELSKVGTDALALEKARAVLLKQFGTDDAAVIQAQIDGRRKSVEATKQGLQDQLGLYDGYVEAAKKKAAELQKSLNDNPNQQGRGVVAAQLTAAEKDLAEQQRIRANILAAIAKLTPAVVKSTKDQTDATDGLADSEKELDRAAKARSDNRREQLQGELADNQRRIENIKKYQAEQAKLFDDKQLTPEVFEARVKGSQDAISQLERNGTALRIRIVREETTGKLVETENERIRLSNKKNITAAELADIEAAAGAKRVGIFRKQSRDIEQIQRELREKLKVEPIEFVAPLDTKSLKKELDKANKVLERGLAQSEKQVDEAGKRTQKAIDDRVHAVEVAENRKQFLQQQTYEFAGTLAGAYFNFRKGQLDKQAATEDARYQKELDQAGDNAELRTKIEEEHARQVAAIRKKQAQAERQQALLSVALNTAQAVTSVLSTGGGTRYADFGVSAATLVALVVAQGVAQAAAILASPIPEFFRGRRGGESVPLASVAERGPELVHEKASGKFMYYAKPSLTSLGAGDDVYTAQETSKMMAAAAGDMRALEQPLGFGRGLAEATAAIQAGRVQVVDNSKQLAGIQQTMQEAVGAMKNLKQVTLNVNGEVSSALVQRGDSLSKSLNQRLINYGGN